MSETSQQAAWDLVIADAKVCGHPPSIINDMIARKADSRADVDSHNHLVRAYQHGLDLIFNLRRELADRRIDVAALLKLGPGAALATIGEDTIDLIGLYAGALDALSTIRLHIAPTSTTAGR